MAAVTLTGILLLPRKVGGEGWRRFRRVPEESLTSGAGCFNFEIRWVNSRRLFKCGFMRFHWSSIVLLLVLARFSCCYDVSFFF